MLAIIPTMLLTAFISVNGQVVQVEADSSEAVAYEQEAVTDVGNPDNLVFDEPTLSTEETATSEPTLSTEETASATVPDNDISVLSEAIELLAENSSTVTGTINSTVLDLMDRMIDSYPEHYKYAGFRTDSDDTYATTLYIAKRVTTNGNTLTFSDDCVAVTFDRYTSSNYNGYIYYNVSDAPNARVNISNRSIVYTNALDGYPSLGKKSRIPTEYVWIGILTLGIFTIVSRRLAQ